MMYFVRSVRSPAAGLLLQSGQRTGALALRSQRSSSSLSHELTEKYSQATSALHWIMGAGILTCFATVQGAMASKDDARKGELMTIHKSTGLLIAAMVPARIALALVARRPGPLPGASTLEHWAASASHLALYFFMIGLPGTGIAMGYFGGKGLPFFGYIIPGASTPNGAIAKNAFLVHKTQGRAFEYLVPLHAGAAAFHAMKGQKIFSRINPFTAGH